MKSRAANCPMDCLPNLYEVKSSGAPREKEPTREPITGVGTGQFMGMEWGGGGILFVIVEMLLADAILLGFEATIVMMIVAMKR